MKNRFYTSMSKLLRLILIATLFTATLPANARFLQEDPMGFEAGDLNVYRYVGNNPVNRTDPSGMAAAQEQQSVDSIGLSLLRGGQIATRTMLSSGANVARFLLTPQKVAISAIAGTIACTFFTLADAVDKAGPDTQITGVDVAHCGVIAMSKPDDIGWRPTALPPISIPNGSDCKKHLNLCLEKSYWRPGNVYGTQQCSTCFDVCQNIKVWPYSTPTGSCIYPGFIDD